MKRDSQTTTTSNTVVTLKGGGGKTSTVRGKSNLSSQSKQMHSANVSASGKGTIPKTPVNQSKLKALSAKKQKSVCSKSIFEEGPNSASFSSAQQFNSQQRRQKTLYSVNQSINFDSGINRSKNCKPWINSSSTAANLNYSSISNINRYQQALNGSRKVSIATTHAASSMLSQPRDSE